MFATAAREGSMFVVRVCGSFVQSYSSPANALMHAKQINDAIRFPKKLNQRPKEKRP